METKKIIECFAMCAKKLGCQRYIVGNCEENVSIGNVLDEAAERLEELDAELEKRTINDRPYEWISVEDERKPKNLHNYFIAYVFGTCDEHLFGESMYIADKGNGIVDGAHFTNEGVDGMRVTHWMEIPKLPEPPKPKEPTFKDVFLEKFPKTPLGYNGALKLCARNVFPQINCSLSNGCAECWKQTYFEGEGEKCD